MGRRVEITPRLRAFLLLQLTVEARDEEATRQALRHTAERLPEAEAMRTVRLLERNITPNSRRWLSELAA